MNHRPSSTAPLRGTPPMVHRRRGGSIVLLMALTVACLAPFAGKAFHMDDTLFLWVARHLQSHPLDFYGFSANWSGVEEPLSTVTRNPPLASYYIAWIARWVGWSEVALHLAFLLPALAAVAGTYVLARQLCERPLLAALAGLLTPVFLLCSTSVMADTMMLAWWVWAAAWWIGGLRGGNGRALLAGACAIIPCALTKYYGAALIPLLGAYALARQRRLGGWVGYLVIPLVALAGYDLVTHALYGRGLLGDAASFAASFAVTTRPPAVQGWFSDGCVALAFAGGCLATVGCYAPMVWSGRALMGGLLIGGLGLCALAAGGVIGPHLVRDAAAWRAGLVAQFGGLVLLGAHLACVAVADLWSRRDAEALLLCLWILGTLWFAAYCNWTITGRSFLVLAPAAGILVMRRLEWSAASSPVRGAWRLAWPLVPAAALALHVTWADYRLAEAGRQAAAAVVRHYGGAPGTLWFRGHWGFQYYMEAGGGRAVDIRRSRLAPGDYVVIPFNAHGRVLPLRPGQSADIVERVQRPVSRWVSTMQFTIGAAFYSDIWGPVPFAIGRVLPEQYDVLRVRGP